MSGPPKLADLVAPVKIAGRQKTFRNTLGAEISDFLDVAETTFKEQAENGSDEYQATEIWVNFFERMRTHCDTVDNITDVRRFLKAKENLSKLVGLGSTERINKQTSTDELARSICLNIVREFEDLTPQKLSVTFSR